MTSGSDVPYLECGKEEWALRIDPGSQTRSSISYPASSSTLVFVFQVYMEHSGLLLLVCIWVPFIQM